MDDMKLTKHQVAVFSGVSMATVEKLLRGQDNIMLDGIMRVAVSLGISVVSIYPTLDHRPDGPHLMTKSRMAINAHLQSLKNAERE